MLRLSPIGLPFIQIGTVDSSNNYAMAQVQAQLADHGTVYFAQFQTNGKGQRGRNWNAEPGKNIILSCVLKPVNFVIDNLFFINASITLGCLDFLKSLQMLNVFIKWPNDLYCKDRKAGGILIESLIQDKKIKCIIAGIGINVNQTSFDVLAKNPVSIFQITGKFYNPLFLAKELCNFLNDRWNLLESTKGRALLLQDYNAHLYKQNEVVTFQSRDITFNAMIKRVNEKGELIVNNGQDISIMHGSYEWVVQG